MPIDRRSNNGAKLWRWLKKIATTANDARRKLSWRMRHGPAESTVPVFIVGAQRSGTSMLGQCLGRSPAIENTGETDPRAFADFFLRSDATITALIDASPYQMMIFKPLMDSHRVAELLAINPRGKAIWAYRNYADRINSAVRRFGRHPLDVFSQFVTSGSVAWQLEGLSTDNQKLLHDLDVANLSESDGAALMWYIRNALFFSQQLEQNEQVMLWSYDRFVADPGRDIEALASFLGTAYDPFMISNVHSRSIGKNRPPALDPRIDELCTSMFARLESVFAAQAVRLA